jgi:hypothetical protein
MIRDAEMEGTVLVSSGKLFVAPRLQDEEILTCFYVR